MGKYGMWQNVGWRWVLVTLVVLVTHCHVQDIVIWCVTSIHRHIIRWQYPAGSWQRLCETTWANWSTLINASKEASVCVPGKCHNKIIRALCRATEPVCTNVHSCMILIQADPAWYETLAGGCCPYPWHMYCMTRRVKSMFRIKNWHV